ncbi:hypothetical protein GCM10010464_79580 [Pseudonocardia yunnanensis]
MSMSINHCAPTACIQPPMLLTNCALHIPANARWWNGAQADSGAGGAVSVDGLVEDIDESQRSVLSGAMAGFCWNGVKAPLPRAV